jgi:hypothetical protein
MHVTSAPPPPHTYKCSLVVLVGNVPRMVQLCCIQLQVRLNKFRSDTTVSGIFIFAPVIGRQWWWWWRRPNDAEGPYTLHTRSTDSVRRCCEHINTKRCTMIAPPRPVHKLTITTASLITVQVLETGIKPATGQHERYLAAWTESISLHCAQIQNESLNIHHLCGAAMNFAEHGASWDANGRSARKKIPAFYVTRRFITVFTTARHRTISWARWI